MACLIVLLFSALNQDPMGYQVNKEINQTEVRRVQAIHGETTFILVIPKYFAEKLKIAKGDYVKCTITDDSLVVRKAEL
jgi:hypothetical protein